MSVSVKAPAKINLLLDVVGRREDGYHVLDTVFQAIDWYDRITVEFADTMQFSCTGGAPQDDSNTALKAVRVFAAYTGRKDTYRITVEKHIPMQAGLAGGSADAAGVLVALNTLTGENLPLSVLCELGDKVGADVPFCVMGGTARGRGTGGLLTPLTPFTDGYFVIVKPSCGVSTPEAYRLVDTAPSLVHPSADAFIEALQNGDRIAMAEWMQNTFESALSLPDCLTAKQQLLEHGAKAACLSGSGSAVFGWFTDLAVATKCAEELAPLYVNARVCRPCGGVVVE